MRRHRQSIWTKGPLGILLSAGVGLLFIFIFLLISAAVIYFFLGDLRLSHYFSLAALAGGSYIGSYICGKYRRHSGLSGGAACGLLIYAAIAISVLISGGGLTGIRKLLLLIAFGAAGGVVGVNSKRPSGLRD